MVGMFPNKWSAIRNSWSDAYLMIDDLEEWPSRRRSEPGPRADEENRARREIPMFLCIRAIKAGS